MENDDSQKESPSGVDRGPEPVDGAPFGGLEWYCQNEHVLVHRFNNWDNVCDELENIADHFGCSADMVTSHILVVQDHRDHFRETLRQLCIRRNPKWGMKASSAMKDILREREPWLFEGGSS